MIIAHLWQSTLVLAAASLAVLALRRRSASTRHALWLLASIKFLVPFSALTFIGGALGAPFVALTSATPAAARWLDRSRPFFTLDVGAVTDAWWLAPLPSSTLAAIWIAGAIALVVWRWRQWRSMVKTASLGLPLAAGREREALQRAAAATRVDRPVALRLTARPTEPIVVGITRATILWPDGLSPRLTDAELDAVLAHELCHVVRRDNLLGLLHIAVETIFWFYPIVWWLSGRLVHERERACDEEVVHMGTDKQSYAAGILKVCGFCLRAPAAFASGIGGARLTERIERILGPASPRATTPAALATVIAALIAVPPVAIGVLDAHRAAPGAAAAPASQEKPKTVYKLGRGIVPPRLVREFKPKYTREAMERKIQGQIFLSAVVLEDGTVTDVKVTRSLDKEYGLDDAAVATAKKWEFKPGTKEGKPVAVEVEIEMSFKLK